MNEIEKTNVKDVASYFIKLSNPGTETSVSNLKLQKLLYYAQGFHHAINEQELFEDRIEAWVHGPVVPSVYQEYKKYNFRDIPPSDVDAPQLSDEVTEFLDDIWSLMKNFSGKELEEKTHREKPWKDIRGDLPEFVYTNTPIPVDRISKYFKENYFRKGD
ncbi:Panacea domain-containing protein [Salimicrobium humidisoli]|uniref:Panacea domain-containing protein n=1 Tax=Salimicrobium humidisoli TaxID=2029857 RepID=UPI0013040E0F|nr:type II toxin-antitoxin system antitoxin SocA domain-containing protein [Salimicrobium humidisoli]